MEKKVGIEDVAKAAGVSKTTVSFAMRDSHRVAPKTREHIQRIAKQLDYSPNPAGRALNLSKKSSHPGAVLEAIGLLVRDTMREQFAQHSRFPWQNALLKHSERIGYPINLFPLPKNTKEAAALERMLRARGIRGILIEAEEKYSKELSLPSESITTVLISGHHAEDRYPNVAADHFKSSFAATEKVLEKGYTRPLLILSEVFSAHEGGFLAAATKHIQLAKNSIVHHKPIDSEACLKAIKAFKPDAIIAQGADVYLNPIFKDLFKDEGIGFCALDLKHEEIGKISGMVTDRIQRNKVAVELLVSILNHSEFSEISESSTLVAISSVWHDGKTL